MMSRYEHTGLVSVHCQPAVEITVFFRKATSVDIATEIFNKLPMNNYSLVSMKVHNSSHFLQLYDVTGM